METGKSREIALSGRQAAPYPPAWSPDGRSIAFVAYEEDAYEEDEYPWQGVAYTVEADGSDLTRVSETISAPSWSPDSQRIGIVRYEDEDKAAIYTVGADGSYPFMAANVKLDASQRWLDRVSWLPDGTPTLGRVSPDGSRIAFRSHFDNIVNIFNPYDLLYTTALNGIDIEVLVKGGHSPEAKNSGWSGYHTDTVSCPEGFVLSDPVPVLGQGWRYCVDITSCSEGFVVPEPEKNPGLVKDCETLMPLRVVLIGLPEEVHTNWGPGTPIRDWAGITVTAVEEPLQPPAPRVTGLKLIPILITLPATMTPSLGRLTELRELTVNHVNIGGHIPRELGNLANLQVLVLSGSELTGSIPSELGNLTNLRVLSLQGSLSGHIPSELGNLSNLQELVLEWNYLTGTIPPELGNLSDLRRLALSGNELTGCIPQALRNVERNDLDKLGLDYCE